RFYQEAKEEGRQEGWEEVRQEAREEGRKEGRRKVKLELIPHLIELGLTKEQMAKVLNSSIEEITEMIQELHQK
ncbi:hypothetical protein VB711_04150, partial [Cronbergia sp. UHCC 0137]|uniref:hypothetical protein n=1 Tax=Cronbergia sp. UHCC 0137 TaxID=3110239 RepID=UPI002B20799F